MRRPGNCSGRLGRRDLDEGSVSPLVLLDLLVLFDMINHGILLERLPTLGVGGMVDVFLLVRHSPGGCAVGLLLESADTEIRGSIRLYTPPCFSTST